MEQLIYSGALYCERETPGHVPIEWVKGALDFFQSQGLNFREFSIGDNRVCAAGSYSFVDNDFQLVAAIESRTVRYVDLYCHSEKKRNLLMDWDAIATINLSRGYAHLGVPVACGLTLEKMLLETYALAQRLASWRYGIGFSRSSSKAPCMYTIGIIGGTAQPDPNDTEEDLDRIACWLHEMRGTRRHLEGSFRDVYPANLLSAAHVNVRVGKNKTLLTAKWGKFTQIDNGLWLWTVPEKDIPKARAALIKANVLLCP